MCGRYVLASQGDLADELHDRFGIENYMDGLLSRFNVAPSQAMPVIIDASNHGLTERYQHKLDIMEWGFLPPWTKDPEDGIRPINARVETVHEKRMFKGSVRHHRCIVPATGFYEWQKVDGGKQPWLFTVDDDVTGGTGIFGIAGIFGEWHGADGTIRFGYALLTTEANDVVAPVHSRMPVVLQPDEESAWLDHSIHHAHEAIKHLRLLPSGHWNARPVSREVNSAIHDHPGLLQPIVPSEYDEDAHGQASLGLD